MFLSFSVNDLIKIISIPLFFCDSFLKIRSENSRHNADQQQYSQHHSFVHFVCLQGNYRLFSYFCIRRILYVYVSQSHFVKKSRIFMCLIPLRLISISSMVTTYLGKLSLTDS